MENAARVCASVQVREQGISKLGTKVEVKNMNSFSAMQRAIDFEIDRQVSLTAGHSTLLATRDDTYCQRWQDLPHTSYMLNGCR